MKSILRKRYEHFQEKLQTFMESRGLYEDMEELQSSMLVSDPRYSLSSLELNIERVAKSDNDEHKEIIVKAAFFLANSNIYATTFLVRWEGLHKALRALLEASLRDPTQVVDYIDQALINIELMEEADINLF